MNINVDAKYKVDTEVCFKVIRNGACIEELKTKNLILNTLPMARASSVNHFCSLFVGTGTTAPVKTDIKLQNALAKSENAPIIGDAPFTVRTPITSKSREYSTTTTFTFTLGAVVGNITEFGIGTGLTIPTQDLITRGLIKDSNNNPVSITVTAQDQLVVTYTIKYSCMAQIIPFSIPGTSPLITGELYLPWQNNVAMGFRGVGLYSAFSAAFPTTAILTADANNVVTMGGTGGYSSITTNRTGALIAEGTSISITFSAGLSEGNIGGIKYISDGRFSHEGNLWLKFDTPLAKDNTKIFSLKVTINKVFV